MTAGKKTSKSQFDMKRGPVYQSTMLLHAVIESLHDKRERAKNERYVHTDQIRALLDKWSAEGAHSGGWKTVCAALDNAYKQLCEAIPFTRRLQIADQRESLIRHLHVFFRELTMAPCRTARTETFVAEMKRLGASHVEVRHEGPVVCLTHEEVTLFLTYCKAELRDSQSREQNAAA